MYHQDYQIDNNCVSLASNLLTGLVAENFGPDAILNLPQIVDYHAPNQFTIPITQCYAIIISIPELNPNMVSEQTRQSTGMEIEVYANISINGQVINLIEPTYILEYTTLSVRDFCNRMQKKYLAKV